MADKRVTVTIEAVDNASATIGKIQKQIEELAGTGGGGKLAAGKAIADGLKDAYQQFDKIQKLTGRPSYAQGFKQLADISGSVVSGAINAGKAFLDLTGSLNGSDLSMKGLIASGLNYDQTMERVRIKTGATKDEFELMTNKVRELTTSTVYGMEEIAGAAEYMAQNGMKASEIVDNLAGVAALATLGNLDLSKAADIAAGTMNMFASQGLNATQVASVLATAANSSGANVEQLAAALQNCGPSAALLNIPFEQVVGTLALMGDNMIRSGKAGTALKNFMDRMAKPTKDAQKAIDDFGLSTAQAKIRTGDLKGGLLEMKDIMDKSTKSDYQKVAAMKQLVGAYGYQGLSAVLNTSRSEMVAMFAAMEKGLVDTTNLQKGMEALMKTTEGQMLVFSANVQLAAYDIQKAFEDSFVSVMDVLNKFMAKINNGEGLNSALKYLAEESKRLGPAIADGITTAINSVSDFVSGGGLDSILQIGSNIITGITDGIINNETKIKTTIGDIIGKFADWITLNGPKIEKAAGVILDGIRDGIETNSDKIGAAAESIMGILNTSLSGQQNITMAMGKSIAVPFVEGFVIGIGESAVTMVGQAVSGLVTTIGTLTADFLQAGLDLGGKIVEGIAQALGVNIEPIKQAAVDLYNWFAEMDEKMPGQGPKSKGEDAGKKVTEGTEKGIKDGKAKTDQAASEMGDGIKTELEQKLASMDASQLDNFVKSVEDMGAKVKSAAKQAGEGFTEIANSARTSFLNVSNICRNQMVNVSNIIRNQIQNARNAFTSQMLSMAAVARTQMVNISNIVRNQAVSWSNIIRNQAQNARNALTSSFMSMAAVARTQMAKVLSVVRSYMSQIAAACNKSFTINVSVNKTVNTTIMPPKQGGPTALTMPSTYSLAGTSAMGSQIGLGTLIGSVSAAAKSGQVVKIEVPLYLEGREIARASAKYMDGELSRVNTRTDRKRGVK